MTEVDNLLAYAQHRFPEWLEKGYYDSIVKQWRTTFPGRIEPLAIEVLERAHREAEAKEKESGTTDQPGSVPPGQT
jgi:hypothetical protein